MHSGIDVLGFGNSLVDLIARVDDAFLHRHNVQKGTMTLVEEARAEQLQAAMSEVRIVSGGSAANTIVGVASFGARAAYVGKVKADDLGHAFIKDIGAIGVRFDTLPAHDGPGTGRCCVLVTPDGQRSMSTYLGASQHLGPADVNEADVRAAAIVYLEGYLWDPPEAKKAFVKAAEIAHAAGRKVALTLSDPFCVGRYRAEFRNLIDTRTVDILFANEAEIVSLYEADTIDAAVEALKCAPGLAIVTRSEKGCVVVEADTVHAVPAAPIRELVDTTGAGDLFAAGFLAGLSQGADFSRCARLGALAAAEVIQHLGARPQVDLRHLAAENGITL